MLRLSAADARRLAARTLVLAGGAICVLFVLALGSADPAVAHFLDCLHWTVAYVAAALVAWLGVVEASGADRAAWVPQVALGVQVKRNRGLRDAARVGLPDLVMVTQLGARDEDDVDYYASATKIWLAQGLLVNATLRYTSANQFGLLGFGGDRNDDASIRAEGTVAYLLQRKVAVGVEYRARGRNLESDDESAAWDAFIAWTANRHVSIVAAHANIGSVAAPLTGSSADQDGAYLSAQVGF